MGIVIVGLILIGLGLYFFNEEKPAITPQQARANFDNFEFMFLIAMKHGDTLHKKLMKDKGVEALKKMLRDRFELLISGEQYELPPLAQDVDRAIQYARMNASYAKMDEEAAQLDALTSLRIDFIIKDFEFEMMRLRHIGIKALSMRHPSILGPTNADNFYLERARHFAQAYRIAFLAAEEGNADLNKEQKRVDWIKYGKDESVEVSNYKSYLK